MSQDTIAAIATPPGVGGIGIIRLSGQNSLSIAESLTQSSLKAGSTQFRKFFDAQKQQLDHGIVLYFKSPHSFTGEDVIELQGHGGVILQEMMLSRVCELGARIAHAGEYSERAFHNDKLDLTQAEAIADLIESGSQAAARAAMRSLQGVFSEKIHSLVESIINLRAYVEAALDFAEEEIDFLAESDIQQQIQNIIDCNQHILDEAEKGRVLNEGMTLAIAGRPNAGKSSLLNYLAGYDAAIVTDIEGTTRDVIREHIALKGVPVKIIDTAGLRDSSDPIEQEGIKRAWHEIDKADVVLLLIDASKGFSEEDKNIESRLTEAHVLRLYTKSDLLDSAQKSSINDSLISTKNGEGIDGVIDLLTKNYADYNQNQSTFIARKRHVEALKASLKSLQSAKSIFEETHSGELMAEDLRFAQKALNQITGEFTTEDLLGKIFSSFCVGK
ncbi:MAG: tRNA uridine-5-carboxymethylaminomethyl(34) synthesis GTPase MnmE [Gammaproteobacteria bacterium]|jgi:tRNA modification GTPase|nr:tRNA uridine-5-carboxymethylaminomethyl(34) synthesis GTPase MnmE [Gammaproteobacteria bacterium]MBT3722389.1 tRNA uridine-5-carboxymethylaminomethyl(34) synthesis GTPase MnmE [Gammaproteobacteria bacterium]MBT4075301.1 tRNA uridine-5-carboxymethylaminomethyl(34) synthesis GTPase MnmE [Gammaproteobacteria bacterium]MBT4196197.1 tRNA uridine-5-carboxymethylaminomethyl(34) synthesis GTPase MnmE [Gammaproteobacteria bacterium]MBT4861243.1 tRNA uridine-5-carboxymethylaminomethyl(34) synthesis GT